MGENELGLKKAILSGEDDLVYLAVMHIEREAGSSEKGRDAFHQLMHAHPEALRLLKVPRTLRSYITSTLKTTPSRNTPERRLFDCV